MAFFSAGFRRQGPMTFLLLGLFQLHLGIATMPGQPVDQLRERYGIAPRTES